MKKHKIPLEVAPPSPADEIGYWRVSTGRDRTPDMQIAAMKRRGIVQENIYGDIASGRKAKRPNLILAIKAMRPGGTLVVWKLDRLGRDTMELYRIAKEFEAEGQNIVSMTEAIEHADGDGSRILRDAGRLRAIRERHDQGAHRRWNGTGAGEWVTGWCKNKAYGLTMEKAGRPAFVAARPPAFGGPDSGTVQRFVSLDSSALPRLAWKNKSRARKVSAGKPAANKVGTGHGQQRISIPVFGKTIHRRSRWRDLAVFWDAVRIGRYCYASRNVLFNAG